MANAERSAEPRFDERLMPAGTSARFALVIVLALVTSAKMVLEFTFAITGQGVDQCELAAGIDVFRQNSDLSVLIARMTQFSGYTTCESRFLKLPPWWLPAGWPVLVLMLAVLFFYADRWWRLRGSRVRPLAEFDVTGNGFVISDEVRDLARKAGVLLDPHLPPVVDLRSATRGACVLGDSRRPVLCLYFGLVAQRLEKAAEGTDDDEFTAVLLHEFAHIRYGDVTAARGTIAVWRAFLVAAVLPYLYICATLVLGGSVVPGLVAASPIDQRDLITTLGLVCLGYLARCDVLRHREIYADRAAGRAGAKRGCWPAREEETSRGRKAVTAFAGMWRSHPGWGLRAAALDDPAVLFTVQILPVFLAGVAAALIDADFQYAIVVFGQNSTWIGSAWMWQGAGALSAALVTLIAGIALWRAVAYARLPAGERDGRKLPARAVPTGLRAGLWLGAGMVAGDLAAGQGTIGQLVPARPEILLLPLAAGAAFGWWTAQCAGAWLARRRAGRHVRLPMAAGLTGGFLILSWWFACWANVQPYSTGFSYGAGGYRWFLEYSYGGAVVRPGVLTAISWAEPFLNPLKYPAADLLAVGAAWVVPLLAWTLRPGVAGTGAGGLPSLKVPLGWAAAGTVATWACVVWAQAYAHGAQPARPPLHGIYELTYFWLLLAAQAGPAVVVALVVGLRRGRLRLLATLIATEATVLGGFAGTFFLVAVDGCVRPLATLGTSCAWRPGLMEWGYTTQVDIPAVLGTVLAFAACALALARPGVWHGRHTEQADPPAPDARPRRAYRRGPVLAGLAGLAALGVALAGIVIQLPAQARYVGAASQTVSQTEFGILSPTVASGSLTAEAAALEVEDWSSLGGAALLSRLQTDAKEISPVLNADYARQHHRFTARDFLDIEPRCADIVAISQSGAGYFLVPDYQARPLWSAFVNMAGTGGRGCESAISLLRRAGFSSSFWAAEEQGFRQIGNAYDYSKEIEARIEAVEEEGGLTGSGNGIAGPPLDVVPPPAGARRWTSPRSTGNPMNLTAFVQKLYLRTTWASEASWLARHGFVSGAREGWYDADGSQEAVIIVQFSGASDAISQFDAYAAYFRRESKPGLVLTDRVDGGVGMVIPASKKATYVTTDIAGRLGRYVIEAQVFARKPDSAAARALLRQQYVSLQATG